MTQVQPPLAPATGGFVVVDVETTGLVAARERVVEIAVVQTDYSGRVLDEWTTLINPDGPVGATHIHGITAAEVRRAPRFPDVVGELTARLAGRALVAHNARFDLAFLQTEFARAGWQMPAAPYLCTLNASSAYLPQLARRRLSDCCWATGTALNEAHSALGDARATAALLAYFLDPARPPMRDHVSLPALAAAVEWPAIPRRPIKARMRAAAGPSLTPAEPGKLAALLDDLPLSSATEEGAPTETTAYLELLAEVLEDGILTDAEAASLVELAQLYALSREQVQAAHRGFLLALAHKAIEDGKVTRAEREELLAAAQVLGFTDRIIKTVLDEATAAFAEERGKSCKPLPGTWPHGEPLRIGQAVAFTGCDDVQRARLEGRAQAVGLRVTGSVSGKTAVLVTNGADPNTTKARAARRHGTRVVVPDVFADMVEYVQPAIAEPQPSRSRSAVERSEHDMIPITPRSSSPQSAQNDDPATIRAWARQHGMTVGIRGRLPAEVLAAYRAAHCAEPSEGLANI